MGFDRRRIAAGKTEGGDQERRAPTRDAMVDILGMGWLLDCPVAEEMMLWSRRRSS
jgi:hypothetical protein